MKITTAMLARARYCRRVILDGEHPDYQGRGQYNRCRLDNPVREKPEPASLKEAHGPANGFRWGR